METEVLIKVSFHRRLSSVSIVTYKRPIFLIALVTIYLGRVMCGETLHLLTCSDDHLSCANHHEAHAGDCGSPDLGSKGCCDGHHHDEQHDQDNPAEKHHHDSTDCWVCQVLGQAETETISIDSTVSVEPIASITYPNRILYLNIGPAAIRARGPPAYA